MRSVIVQYRVKPDRASENERLVGGVFEQLARERPDGLRYFSFKQPDGVSFVHVAMDERADGTSALGKLAAFKEFVAGVNAPPVHMFGPRCCRFDDVNR